MVKPTVDNYVVCLSAPLSRQRKTGVFLLTFVVKPYIMKLNSEETVTQANEMQNTRVCCQSSQYSPHDT